MLLGSVVQLITLPSVLLKTYSPATRSTVPILSLVLEFCDSRILTLMIGREGTNLVDLDLIVGIVSIFQKFRKNLILMLSDAKISSIILLVLVLISEIFFLNGGGDIVGLRRLTILKPIPGRVSMFLVTDINGMTNFVAVSTDLFITTKLWASVILVRKTIFLKTDTLSVTQLSTKSARNGIGTVGTGVVNKGNRGNIFLH